MKGICVKCKEWRKEQYWNAFPDNKHSFFKIMIDDYRKYLRIPRKFKADFKGKLSENVILRGPSGNCWITTLAKRREDFVLQNGWQNFVKDHNLNEGDLLVFHYVEDSLFEVMIFDATACEREDCHFVEPNVEGCCSQRHDILKRNKSPAPVDQQQLKRGRKKRINKKESLKEKEDESDNIKGSQQDNSGTDSETREGKNDSTSRYSTYYKSNRRTITKKDMERAFLLASKYTTKRPSCKIRMKPSHVHHLFILTVPREFADNCLPMKPQNISLRVGSNTWKVKLNRRNAQCTLNGGWAKFVLDNNLETEDICVLELAHTGTGQEPTTLDVHIFRAVEEVVPLEVVKPFQPQ
ncbi:hypothetical protein RDABS01_004455 [Bienertia sinuspersici]